MFSTDDAITRSIYANGGWAEAMIIISKMFYQGEPAPLIIDVGANLGAYCIPIAKDIQAEGGLVHCFEPQRIVYYQLCGNIFLNRLDNVHAFNMAVGDTDGKLTLPAIDYAATKNIGGFTLDDQARDMLHSVQENQAAAGNEVPITRLDSLVFPKAPALIKIDVEGLELQVLQGAVNLLEEHRFPPLLLEAWSLDWFKERRQELVDYIGSLGYSIFVIQDEIIAQHPSFPRQVKFTSSPTTGIQMVRTR